MLAKFIPLREAAEIIGVSPKHIENWLAGRSVCPGQQTGKKKWVPYLDDSFIRYCPVQFRGKKRGFLQPDLNRYIASQMDKTKPRDPGFFVKEIL